MIAFVLAVSPQFRVGVGGDPQARASLGRKQSARREQNGAAPSPVVPAQFRLWSFSPAISLQPSPANRTAASRQRTGVAFRGIPGTPKATALVSICCHSYPKRGRKHGLMKMAPSMQRYISRDVAVWTAQRVSDQRSSDSLSQPAPIAVAIAILYRDNQFLMQLRDDIPTIIYPGHWAFFGGHIEPGETPQTGVLRELKEEISYQPDAIVPFNRYTANNICRHVFAAALTVDVEELVLGEGADLKLLTVDEIRQGQAYSAKLNQIRPLGQPHQQILLDFIAHSSR